MKKNLFIWQFVGITFTAVLGTLLHFLYEWTSLNFVAPISAVNESTWEHMKILFFPMLVYAVVQSIFFKEQMGFWSIKLVGILLGTFLIPIVFYTYNGAFGKSPDWLNVAFFFLSAGATYLLETWLFKREWSGFLPAAVAKGVLVLLALAFVAYTYFPPQLPLFQDPHTKSYGLQA